MLTQEQLDKLELKIYQPRKAYRYNEDSVFLASFLDNIKKGSVIADLGAGCGIISLIISKRFEQLKIYAVEIQKEMYSILKKNIKENNLESVIVPLNEDYRFLHRDYHQYFDIVISNPPYRKPTGGRVSKDLQKAMSRHETCGSLEELLVCASRILKDKGRIYLSFLAERMTDLLYNMRENRLEPKKILPVYPFINKNSNLIIVEGVKKGGQGLVILPPFFRRDTLSL